MSCNGHRRAIRRPQRRRAAAVAKRVAPENPDVVSTASSARMSPLRERHRRDVEDTQVVAACPQVEQCVNRTRVDDRARCPVRSRGSVAMGSRRCRSRSVREDDLRVEQRVDDAKRAPPSPSRLEPARMPPDRSARRGRAANVGVCSSGIKPGPRGRHLVLSSRLANKSTEQDGVGARSGWLSLTHPRRDAQSRASCTLERSPRRPRPHVSESIPSPFPRTTSLP